MKKFVIVGTQRTGSTALSSGLSLHPKVQCGWEWNLNLPLSLTNIVSRTDKALHGEFDEIYFKPERDHIRSVVNEQTEFLGYRQLFRSSGYWFMHPRLSLPLILDRFELLRRYFVNNPDITILHIVRNNDIDWLKSKYLALAAQSYGGKVYPEDLQVEIPLDAAVRRVKAKHWLDNNLSRLAESNPYQRIIYEDLNAAYSETINLGLKSLGLEEYTFEKQATRKQSSRKSSDYISNHEELEKTLGKLELQDSLGCLS